ncbi:TPA: phage terminase large subunit, partial [Neisseria gonorrhoeae]
RRMEQAAPYVFAGQYLQRPAPPDGGTFKPDNLQFVKALPAGNIRWVRAWDLASTANGGDYTAGGRLGVTEDGRYIIANVVRGRYGADERDRILRNTAQKDGVKTKISIPQDPGQAGKSQTLYLTRQLAGFSVSAGPESGDKVTRAGPFAAQVNIGNVMVLDDGTWDTDALIAEMRMFPNGRHDDQIDCLGRAFGELLDTRTGMIDFLRSQVEAVK